MKTKIFHNFERELVRGKLKCYTTEMAEMREEDKQSPRFYMLKGKMELCVELLQ